MGRRILITSGDGKRHEAYGTLLFNVETSHSIHYVSDLPIFADFSFEVRSHLATVSTYTINDGQHYVAYDSSNERKWHRMNEITFSVIGESPSVVYRPRNVPASKPTVTTTAYSSYSYGGGGYGGANYYQRPWTPFESLTVGARTACSFHVVIDGRSLRDGDRLFLCGNLEAMGGWDVGHALAPNPKDPAIWSATIDLPYTTADFCGEREGGGVVGEVVSWRTNVGGSHAYSS